MEETLDEGGLARSWWVISARVEMPRSSAISFAVNGRSSAVNS